MKMVKFGRFQASKVPPTPNDLTMEDPVIPRVPRLMTLEYQYPTNNIGY